MFATLGDEKSRLFIRVSEEGVGTDCETRCAKNRVESSSFGGKKFWQSRKVRAALIRCMTVFVLEMQSKSRKDNASKEIMVEYKQGMHEILAMVYLATSRAATSFARIALKAEATS